MAGKGGPVPGAGRKPKHEEEKIRNIARAAIDKTYGSMEEGFMWLLQSNEPSLIKFAWEHAAGKPKEKLEIDSNSTVQSVQIIELPDNNRDKPNEITDAEVIEADNG